MAREFRFRLSIKINETWIFNSTQDNGGAEYNMHYQYIENSFGEVGKFAWFGKWSSMYSDMQQYSLLYPNIVFRIDSREQSDSIDGVCEFQSHFFKNGLAYSEHSQIIHPKFNEEKLLKE